MNKGDEIMKIDVQLQISLFFKTIVFRFESGIS